jgi:hypothetical protein
MASRHNSLTDLHIYAMPIKQAPKADFDAVPVIDFSLAKTDRKVYFEQLKFAVEDVGFGVSTFIL